jgi:hypothetical protein
MGFQKVPSFVWSDALKGRYMKSVSTDFIAERCPSWPKERDWKSRVPPKSGTVGSNPTLSAILFPLDLC